MRRHVLQATGLALAAALTLTACGGTGEAADADGVHRDRDAAFPRTVEHAMGATEIPARPERVVVLDTGELDSVLSLGVTPVGAVTTAVSEDFLSYLAEGAAGRRGGRHHRRAEPGGDRRAAAGPHPVQQGPPRGPLRAAVADRPDGLRRARRRGVEGQLRGSPPRRWAWRTRPRRRWRSTSRRPPRWASRSATRPGRRSARCASSPARSAPTSRRPSSARCWPTSACARSSCRPVRCRRSPSSARRSSPPPTPTSCCTPPTARPPTPARRRCSAGRCGRGWVRCRTAARTRWRTTCSSPASGSPRPRCIVEDLPEQLAG